MGQVLVGTDNSLLQSSMRHLSGNSRIIASEPLFTAFVSGRKILAATHYLDRTQILNGRGENQHVIRTNIRQYDSILFISTLPISTSNAVSACLPRQMPRLKELRGPKRWELDMTCGQLGNIWLHGSKAVVALCEGKERQSGSQNCSLPRLLWGSYKFRPHSSIVQRKEV